jgi:hypothetical protein
MRSSEPLRDLCHFHPADGDWGMTARPGSGWPAGTDMSLEPLGNAANDWEQYWIDLGGEG